MSLYTCLNILNQPGVNISTVEDPAEINLPGVNQVNVNDKAGLTFAAALKSFLRQDPDIIMVGEIRDLETADIAIKAAQTGHLVMSTLHTNDAPTTLTRMLNMGVAPFNIASSVLLITAQRLARRLCENCKAPADFPREALLEAGFKRRRSGRQLEALPAGRLLGLQQRLQGPGRHLPGDADHRGHPAHHPGRRHRAGHRRAGAEAKACATCASPACSRSAPGVDLARRSDRGHQRMSRPRARHPTDEHRTAGGIMATAAARAKTVKEFVFEWEGKDHNGKLVRGEIRAGGEAEVNASLRRQGILVTKVKKRRTQRRPRDQAEGHRHLHAPAGDDDEGRRAAAAGLRHRGPRQRQPAA